MKKIATFKFEVSNAASLPTSSDIGTNWYCSARKKLSTPQKIDDRINEFMSNLGCEIIDIRINTVEVNYHNNGRGNTVELWYTIIYEDDE